MTPIRVRGLIGRCICRAPAVSDAVSSCWRDAGSQGVIGSVELVLPCPLHAWRAGSGSAIAAGSMFWAAEHVFTRRGMMFSRTRL